MGSRTAGRHSRPFGPQQHEGSADDTGFLQRSPEVFRQRIAEVFFEEAPVGIVLLDSAGEVTECNPAFCRLVSREAQSLRRVPLIDFINREDQPPLKAAFERLKATEGAAAVQAPLEVHMGESKEMICSLYITKMEGEGRTRR